MTAIDFVLALIDVIITAGANIVFKFAVNANSKVMKLFLTLTGFGIYFLMSFISVYLYSRYSLALIQALLTLTLIFTPFLARLFFKEELDKRIWIAILFIVLGISLIGFGQSQI